MKVWLNGKLVDRDEATVSVFDAGLQHGVGLFETMLARNGRVFRGPDHTRRLAGSARDLMLTERLQVEPLVEAVHATLAANAMQRARVRLTLTGGNLNMLQSNADQGAVDPTILIVTQPPTEYPEAFFTEGVTVMIADDRANPLDQTAGHKTLNYWPRIRALQVAATRRASEAMWFTVSNHLAGGSVSNVFLIKDQVLFTPIARGEEERGAIPSPVLPGITRKVIIEIAEERSYTVIRKLLDIEDVLTADEVFLTNSSWGVLPVVGIERESIRDGQVGPRTAELREAWLERVEQETRQSV